jgi:hypothetical protein
VRRWTYLWAGLLFFCATTATIRAQSPSGDESPPATLEETIARMANEPDAAIRVHLVYELTENLERGRLSVSSPAQAEELVQALVRVLDDKELKHARGQAARFLSMYPHPAAREALLRIVSSTEPADFSSHSEALQALAVLKEPAIVPVLLAELHYADGRLNAKALRMLVDVGGYDVRDSLSAILLRSADEYKDRVTIRRALRDLELRLDSGLVNSFDLDDSSLRLLRDHGFVLLPSDRGEMFELYDEIYPFVTTDVVFHTFMIMMRAAMQELDGLVLAPAVAELSQRLVADCLDQSRKLDDRSLVALAERNAACFAVPACLLSDRDPQALGFGENEVRTIAAELQNVQAAQDIALSPIMSYEEDYTKYRPRGRHSSTPELQAYYKAMLYLGRSMFRLEDGDQARQALLILDLFERDPSARGQWGRIDSLLGQLFGERDDLAIPDYETQASAVVAAHELPAGPDRFRRLLNDPALSEEFVARIRALPGPRINTAYLGPDQSAEWRAHTRGLRIFGQRYTPPINVLQQSLDAGMWPVTGLSVAARLLGSSHAAAILTEAGDDPAPGPTPAPAGDPYASLSDAYLHCMRSLFQPETGAPAFTRQALWEEKQINTALGAWAEVQHATALYTKDANVYLCGSAVTDRFHGYVEPVPVFYARLDSTLLRMEAVLEACGLFEKIEASRAPILDSLHVLEETRGLARAASRDAARGRTSLKEAAIRIDRAALREFSGILGRLERIAAGELRGQAQSIDDGLFLKGLGRRLMYLSFNRSGTFTARQSMALIVDVASEYSSAGCLEIGVGRPLEIYVAVPDSGRTFVCRGAAYSYYEFVQPISDRLDDERWRELTQDWSSSPQRPWVATRPDLGLTRTASRAELEALRDDVERDGSNSYGGSDSWRPARYEDGARHLAGTITAPEDIDVLISLANQEAVNLGVRVYALTRLADFGKDPRVLACYEAQIDQATEVAGTSLPSHLNCSRLYYSVVGLGSCGVEALPALESAEKLLSCTDGEMLQAGEDALGRARETIARYPGGRSRTD